MPILLTVVAAGFLMVNQGWLVPRGEQKLALITQKMARGDFGHVLSAGDFHQLGTQATLYFDDIDEADFSLSGVMVLDGERVQAAWIDRHARKGKGPSDHAPVIVDLDEAPDGDIGPVVPPPSAPVTRRGAKKLPQTP